MHNVEGMSGRGYSSKVIKALGDARASSTNKVYDSKWRLFATFCSSRGIVPEVATPPQVAEFLIYLFDVRKCSSRTIAAYRSALGNVLRFTSCYDPGEDKVLSQLLKGFERKRAPVARRIPSWDLGLVLKFLAEEENFNDNLSLHLLTAKAVFLLSLATAGRCHSLAALENKVVVVSHDPFVLQIGYHLSYVPKQYYRLKDRKPITPVLLEAMPPGECDALCPVTTLIAYRKRVASLRKPGQSSLFIPHDTSKPTRLHPAAVGRYVVKVILLAYERAGIRPPRGVRAHDVRGVATSLRALTGTGLAEVLAAGQWSQPHTFVKFYLKDFPRGHLQSLGEAPPFFAAGGMISASAFL